MIHKLNSDWGAWLQSTGSSAKEPLTRFRVWAPLAKRVKLKIVHRDGARESVLDWHRMRPDGDGFFSIEIKAAAGTLYRYKIDENPGRPDPRSRFQPFGVHGPSQVVDSDTYQWQDNDWQGVSKRDLVIYELHLGSFTSQGTYIGAIERLDDLVDLGITAIEILPLAQSPGKWNWGYDGVNFFAPRNTFGTPDELKSFVDACHARGLAVIIDVVYNHVGPEGNYLSDFGPYASQKHGTPWGDALNFDEQHADQVRQFVIDNVLFWIDEFHFDGLRLDAVHYMFDDSSVHILDSIRVAFRQHQSTLDRKTYLIGEANIYDSDLVGAPHIKEEHYDAIWSDCIMHSIIKIGHPDLKLTDREYQFTDLAESLEHGYIFAAPKAVRVTNELRKKHHPAGSRKFVESMITALQTHDSVGNHPHGSRLHQLTSVDFQMAAAPLILLYPSIPMIFMGEESAIESPFPFFADFEDQRLRNAVDRGRKHEYPHHNWQGSPLPSNSQAFYSSVFNPADENQRVKKWYATILAFRKKGIDAGWLDVENLSFHFDLENHVYRLNYQHGNSMTTVCCRIDHLDANPVPWPLDRDDRLQFDSQNELCIGGNESMLPRQCLIWIR